jgi:hypothetical protein
LLAAPTTNGATTQRALKPEAENLGDGLLDGLDGAAFAPSREAPKPEGTPRKAIVDRGRIQQQMERDAARGGLGEQDGEDVGESPLVPVVRGMQRAEGLIADEGNAVPEQRKVVAELDKLIAQMEKQCQGGGQSKKPSSKKDQQKSQRSGAKPGQGSKPAGLAEGRASTGAKTSTTATQKRKPVDPRGKAESDLVKEAWGHLPARMRERMMQGSADEFLPEYREELEAYYRRLAEREAER